MFSTRATVPGRPLMPVFLILLVVLASAACDSKGTDDPHITGIYEGSGGGNNYDVHVRLDIAQSARTVSGTLRAVVTTGPNGGGGISEWSVRGTYTFPDLRIEAVDSDQRWDATVHPDGRRITLHAENDILLTRTGG
jgi:hypothetical protein